MGALLLTGVTLIALTAWPAAAQIASSTFDFNSEGWIVQGDATSGNPAYNATGGNPGGHLSANDSVAGGVWYWKAPSKFLGNDSGAYNQLLTFDLRQSALDAQFSNVDVYLIGSGITLTFDTPNNPGTNWTSYNLLLNEMAGWKVGTLSGAAPTQAQMQSVLSNVTDLRIRGEYRTGSDTGRLDNVVLNGTRDAAAPEPGSLALAASGVIALVAVGRRRRKLGRRRF